MAISYYKDFIEKEEDTAKATLKKFTQEFKLYEGLFNLCGETYDCIAKSTESKLFDTVAKSAVIFVLPRIVQSLHSIRLLTAKGYYYDSALVTRGLVESIGLCEYLSSNEEEANRWFKGKPIRLGTIHLFDYALGKNYAYTRKLYGWLCDYVHTNLRGAISLYEGKSRKRATIAGSINVNFQFQPKFDQKEVAGISCYPILTVQMLEHVFNKELKPYKNRQRKSDRLTKLWLKNVMANFPAHRKKPVKSSHLNTSTFKKPPKLTIHPQTATVSYDNQTTQSDVSREQTRYDNPAYEPE